MEDPIGSARPKAEAESANTRTEQNDNVADYGILRVHARVWKVRLRKDTRAEGVWNRWSNASVLNIQDFRTQDSWFLAGNGRCWYIFTVLASDFDLSQSLYVTKWYLWIKKIKL